MIDPDPDPVLEFALEQELCGERPPDLVDRLLGDHSRRPRGRSFGQHLLSAAVVLIALGLLAVIWSVADARGDSSLQTDPHDPVPWHTDLIVPESVDQVARLLGEADQITARVFAVRDPGTGRLVAVVENPLANLFGGLFGNELTMPEVQGDVGQRVAWTNAVADALLQRTHDAAPFAANPLELLFRVPDRGTLVVGVDDTVDPMIVQVRGLGTAWSLPAGHGLSAMLREATDPLLGDAIADHGLALGRDGLASLPADATRIRAWSLDADDLVALERFHDLGTLDLLGSPAAVEPAALRVLHRCPKLRSIVLPARGIGLAHLEALIDLPELGELFIGPVWPAAFGIEVTIDETEIDDRCASLLAGAPKLTELFLPSTRMTDVGLASLAALPGLRRLWIGSPSITGSGLGAFADHRGLRVVGLWRCPQLAAAGLEQIGAALDLATGDLILVDCPISAVGIAALLAHGRVRDLGLVRCRPTTTWPDVLAAIRSSAGVRKLTLQLDGALLPEHLLELAGTPRLEKIEAPISAGVVPADLRRQLDAALPGVGVDLWSAPR